MHVHGAEGVGPAAADGTDGAQMAAEAASDFLAEGGVIEGHEAGGVWRALGPDDGGEVFAGFGGGHGELGEGAGGQEMLECDAVMRQFVGDGADNAGLVVGPGLSGDAGLAAQRAAAAFGGDDQRGGQGFAG